MVEMKNIITKTLYNVTDGNVLFNHIKNPYTNIPFCKSNLFNIYHTIKRSNHNVPKIFYFLYDVEFNYSKFYSKHKTYIMTQTLKCQFENLMPEKIYGRDGTTL